MTHTFSQAVCGIMGFDGLGDVRRDGLSGGPSFFLDASYEFLD